MSLKKDSSDYSSSVSGSSSTIITNTSTQSDKDKAPYFTKRSFSAQKMLTKAKDTTKSLVHDVLDKRHSSESKRSVPEEDRILTSSSSNSLPSRKMAHNAMDESSIDSDSTSHNPDKSILRTLSSRQKHYSLPIKRPFIIKRNSSTKSLGSLSSNSMATKTTTSSLAAATTTTTTALEAANNAESEVVNPAAVAEANILNGEERPGSFATACDFRLANEKRNDEFHALFKSVQEKDMLIQGLCSKH